MGYFAMGALTFVAVLGFLYAVSPTIRADLTKYFDLYSEQRGKVKNGD